MKNKKAVQSLIARNPHDCPKWDRHCDKDEYAITRADYVETRAEAPVNYRYQRPASA